MISLALLLACAPSGDAVADPFSPVVRTGTAVEVAVGANVACSLHVDGSVWCWGSATAGLLGDPAIDGSEVWSPVRVVGIDNAVGVSTFLEYACALLDDGDVSCWGWNHHLQLGSAVGPGETARQAIRLPDVHDVVALAAGHHHVCAVHVDGTSSCWGDPYRFALGDGERRSSPVPVASAGVSDAVSVSAGFEQACVIEADGGLSCWGDNYFGVLGTGDSTPRDQPTQVDLDPVVDADIDNDLACAVHDDGGVSCWGRSVNGGDEVHTPVRLDWLEGIVEVDVGQGVHCALGGTGALYCWGYDELGAPEVAVDLPLGIVAVEAGGRDACAVDEAGEVLCVGRHVENPIVLGLGEAGEWVQIPDLPRAD